MDTAADIARLAPTRRTLLAATLAGSGAIHLAMAPAHAGDHVALAVAFALCGWAQVMLAAAALTDRGGRTRLATVAVTVAALGAWLLSRTVGMPVGHASNEAEAVGLIDLVVVAFEVVTLGLVAGRLPRRVPAWMGPAGLAAIALTSTAALASPSAGEHGHETSPSHVHGDVALTTSAHDHLDDVTDDHDDGDGHFHDDDAAADTETADGEMGTAAATGTIHAHDADGDGDGDTGAAGGDASHDHAATTPTDPAPHAHDAAPAPAAPTDHDHAAPSDGGGLISHPHHGAPCTEPITDAQQATAAELAAGTLRQLEQWSNLADAEAAGFVPLTPTPAPLVHYGNKAWMVDGRMLDPTRPESLVFAFDKAGTPYLLGAMFLAEPGQKGPQVGGCLTQWHDHTNLCLGKGGGMVGTVDADGNCPAGSVNKTTSEMLHVWDLPLAGGPFSEATPVQLRDALIAKLRGA